MTLEDVKNMLAAVGVPVAYNHFETEPDLPYIVFTETSTRTLARDDAVGPIISMIQVELRTRRRNIELERQLETAMAGQIWRRTLDFSEDEHVYSVFYQFEILQ